MNELDLYDYKESFKNAYLKRPLPKYRSFLYGSK